LVGLPPERPKPIGTPPWNFDFGPESGGAVAGGRKKVPVAAKWDNEMATFSLIYGPIAIRVIRKSIA
jgi:hypothetical protein